MQLWTEEHFWQLLPTVFLMVVIAIILGRLLGKKPLKIRMIPFQILAVILLLAEIGKQAISFHRGYDLYHIPFHVCSLFIFLIPAMAFYRGRYARSVRSITCSVCVSLILFMVVYPNLIYSPDNITGFFDDYFNFHTVFSHNLVIFAFILILALKLHSIEREQSDLKPMVLFSTSYALIAAVMSQILKTNYSNFYSCNIPPVGALVASVKASIGNALGQLLYISVLFILHVLFFVGSYYLYLAIDRFCIARRQREKRQKSAMYDNTVG